MPSTSPIAQPVRQCNVADAAADHETEETPPSFGSACWCTCVGSTESGSGGDFSALLIGTRSPRCGCFARNNPPPVYFYTLGGYLARRASLRSPVALARGGGRQNRADGRRLLARTRSLRGAQPG